MTNRAGDAKSYESLIVELDSLGLTAFGLFHFEAGNGLAEHLTENPTIGLLLGNVGPGMWQVFSLSKTFEKGGPDPLNRWTKEVLERVAGRYGIDVIFPFGETVWPFQQFAVSAMGLKPSPLGLLIHPEFGLWHAYRGALLIPSECELYESVKRTISSQKPSATHPCDSCVDRPCLSNCPVNAFGVDGLNVERCTSHLDSKNDPNCMSLGCNARNACPVGVDYRYQTEQLAFHMQAFRRSRA